jgi:hypothetical protein
MINLKLDKVKYIIILQSMPHLESRNVGLPYGSQILQGLGMFDLHMDCECFRLLHVLYYFDIQTSLFFLVIHMTNDFHVRSSTF